MASIFNLNVFRNETANRGIHRSNKWLALIPLPATLRANNILSQYANQNNLNFSVVQNRIMVWCDAGPLPGVGLHSRPLMTAGYGSTEKKPTHPLFEDVSLSFINDGQSANWTFFQQWINSIVNYDSSRGTHITGDFTDPYEVNYKDDYCVDIVLQSYNEVGDNTTSILIREAYPNFISPLNMNWGDSNIQRITVSFTYVDWYNLGIKKNLS